MSIKNPMHPGEFLLEAFMKPFGIGVKKMADALGFRSQQLAVSLTRRLI